LVSVFADDGPPLMYPAGRLDVDRDEDLLRCHFCGRWWKALNSHARNSHGISAAEYRRLAGLKRTEPLTAPSVAAARAAALRRRMKTDPRIAEGMAEGARLAREGVLVARRLEVHRQEGLPLARLRQLGDQAREKGAARTERFRAHRESQARRLGFDSLDDYLRRRRGEGALLGDLQRELGASYSVVRADLARAGLPVPRGNRRRRPPAS
jgi:hypothetical protein